MDEAGRPALSERPKRKVKPRGEAVEIFAGINGGQLEASLIPKDSTQVRLLVKNKTDKPLAEVSDKPGLAEVCGMLGRKEINQRVAQLAAWHLANDMSWEKLAKIRKKVTFGTQPQYSQRELAAAKKAVEKAVKTAKQRRQKSPGKAKSLSQ